ncbi:MAG: helix-turn-helix domain-containing protein [Neisseria sp.]|uniref:helix-turn-helix domain-containing protein n=1 Tax=Neisseria sp. TaxID=192066 RepID=UPI0026DC5C0E|nr:helix-turn-helix domain-containing protein [Neisseria sp.]MDO4247478.1 helix-turn-helix domain-containing protein [Neisseria sp.]
MEFVDFLYRIKQELDLKQDKDVADFLGLSEKAFSARKRRGSIPEDKLRAELLKRSDLNVDLHYILTGERKVEKTTNVDLTTYTESITLEEKKLIEAYRAASDEAKTALIAISKTIEKK